MSDTENTAAASKDAMPQTDVDFLMACLKNTVGGSISVDQAKVAEDLGFKNFRSVGNKLTVMKKKYGIPLSTAGSGGAKKEKATDTAEGAILSSPSKVIKKRAPTKIRKPVAKTKKEESGDENGDSMAVQEPVTDEDYEAMDDKA